MINKEDFFNELKDIFEDDDLSVGTETLFRDIDDWSSLTGMAIQVFLKEKYKTDLPTEVFKELNTIGDIYDFVVSNNLE